MGSPLATLRSLRSLLAGLALLVACTPDEVTVGDFMDVPFGGVGLEVKDLSLGTVQPVMDFVNTRLRSYIDLREHVPFEILSTPGCLSDITQGLTTVSFVLDLGCALAGAKGFVSVFEEDLVTDGPSVTRLVLDYQEVQVDGFSVHGVEIIVDTDAAAQGSSKRTLLINQDGRVLDYTFRMGALADDQVAIDYAFALAKGDLPARLVLPSGGPGALGTVFLTTLDGGLQCELRNTGSEVLVPAKGFCDNGLVFGLAH